MALAIASRSGISIRRRFSPPSGRNRARPGRGAREGERSQKRYRITPHGVQELSGWLRTPPELVPPPRDELVAKVLVALQVPGIDIHALLQVHRRHVIEVMQRYTRIKSDAAEDDVPIALVADAEL